MNYVEVMTIYAGSDGEATKALYAKLQAIGSAGEIALNLFRACKCSERAKVYKGGNGRGSFRSAAYDRKQWSIDNLCVALAIDAEQIGMRWGWKEDTNMSPDDPFRNVLYVDIPTGQVSFHSPVRGKGPSYTWEWDKVKGKGPDRICRWIARLLGVSAETSTGAGFVN